jgi:fructuronate reductase
MPFAVRRKHSRNGENMELNLKSLNAKDFWKGQRITLPLFNVAAVRKQTAQEPRWLHFGPGNIFRAFIANLQQQLLDTGKVNYGIITVAPNSAEIIDTVYKPHDNLSLLVTMCVDGSMQKKVIGSVTEALACVPGSQDWQRLVAIMQAPSLQILSFTITEKGYALKNMDGTWLPAVAQDLVHGHKAPQNFMSKLTALLLARYEAGKKPVTLLSLDNCSHNGDKVKESVLTIAQAWAQAELVPDAFVTYLKTAISYPCTMIDKITPRPAESVQQHLQDCGFTDLGIVTSKRGGYYAPFVNAEEKEYLVVEDDFKCGRPPLEAAGVIFTDRETVDKVEKMKVSTCLNPLHTTLAVYGCLLGYHLIADELEDKELLKLIQNIGKEGMQVVTDPGVLSPQKFLQECLTVRFPNHNIPDTPQRIACDTSQKVGVRFGATVKGYGAKAGDLVYLPLAIAGWCRYLLGIDDKGAAFKLSPDPLLPELTQQVSQVKLGAKIDAHAALQGILSSTKIFGSDLYATVLGTKVEKYFTELCAGKGAVRKTLQKYLC